MRCSLTTADLDEVSACTIASMGAKPNFLGYYGFPATVCISVNDVIVHGIPGNKSYVMEIWLLIVELMFWMKKVNSGTVMRLLR